MSQVQLELETTTNNIESRSYKIELRASKDEDSRTVEGYAAVFDSFSQDLGWFREIIEPGAFRNALKTSDVRALLNHDPNHLLGRESSGTLRLKEDKEGLFMSVDLPESRSDILELVERGDLAECSFAFRVAKQVWEEEVIDDRTITTRRIQDIEFIKDVTLATFPAYEDTSVAKRTYGDWKGTQEKQEKETENKINQRAQEERERELFLLEHSI